jgi:predicted methyltransferase MtxX (methanogen marker protein 4)
MDIGKDESRVITEALRIISHEAKIVEREEWRIDMAALSPTGRLKKIGKKTISAIDDIVQAYGNTIIPPPIS